MAKRRDDTESYHLAPKALLGANGYADLRRYMRRLRSDSKPSTTVALVLAEDGELHFVDVQIGEAPR